MRLALLLLLAFASSACAGSAMRTAMKTGVVERPCEPGWDGPARVEQLGSERLVVPCGADAETWEQTLKRLGLRLAQFDDLILSGDRLYPRYVLFGSPYEVVIAWRDGANRVLGLTDAASLYGVRTGVIQSSALSTAAGLSDSADTGVRGGQVFELLDGPLVTRSEQDTLETGAAELVRRSLENLPSRERPSEAFWERALAAAAFLVRSGRPDPLAGRLEEALTRVADTDPAERAALLAGLADPEGRRDPQFRARYLAWERAQYDAVASAKAHAAQAVRDAELAERRAQEAKTAAERAEALDRFLEGARKMVAAKRYFTALALLGWRALERGGPAIDLDRKPERVVALRPELPEPELVDALVAEVRRLSRASARFELSGVEGARVLEASLGDEADGPPLVRLEGRVSFERGTLRAVDRERVVTRERTVKGPDVQAERLNAAKLAELRAIAGPLVEEYQRTEARIEAIDARLAQPEMQVILGAGRSVGVDQQRLEQDCTRLPGGGYTCKNRWVGATKYDAPTVSAGRSPFETAELEERRRELAERLDELRGRLAPMAGQAEALAAARPAEVERTVRERSGERYRTVEGEGRVVIEVKGRAEKLGAPVTPGYHNAPPGADEGRMIAEDAALTAQGGVGELLRAELLRVLLAGEQLPKAELDAERELVGAAMMGQWRYTRDALRTLGYSTPCWWIMSGDPGSCSW